MSLNDLLSKPITYLITSGETTAETKDFSNILNLISAAVAAGISLVQLREKQLTGRQMFDLAIEGIRLTRGSSTRLLINDRADIARAVGADGVHLTRQSLSAATVRKTFGQNFIVGVSTHSLPEAHSARDDGADFAVFGPVFEPISKQGYGNAQGTVELARLAQEEYTIFIQLNSTLESVRSGSE